VLIEPGHVFFDKGNPKNSFRIGFPSVANNKINAGLREISLEAREMLR